MSTRRYRRNMNVGLNIGILCAVRADAGSRVVPVSASRRWLSARLFFQQRDRFPIEGPVALGELGRLRSPDSPRCRGRPGLSHSPASGFPGQPPGRTSPDRWSAASVLAPKLLPEETCRWIVNGFSPDVTTLMRAPMAARLVFLPTSFTVSQWFPWPGFWNKTL